MAVYFQGTSTKTMYEVGKAYKTSDGKVVYARLDGSFGNSKTGQYLPGSSGNRDVEWRATGDDIRIMNQGYRDDLIRNSQGGFIYDDPRSSSANGYRPGGSGGGSQGSTKVVNPAARATASNRGAFVRSALWSGKDEPGQDNLFAGVHLKADPRFTNAELYEARYGDFGSAVIGLGILLADGVYTGTEWFNKPSNQKAMAAGARGMEKSLWEGAFSFVDNVRHWGEENAAKERALNEARTRFNDAWDLREKLQAEEANTHHWNGVVSPGKVWN